MTGLLQVFSVNKIFLVIFQDGCKNNLSLNQLAIVIVEKILEEKEPEVFAIPGILEEQVKLEKGQLSMCLRNFMVF